MNRPWKQPAVTRCLHQEKELRDYDLGPGTGPNPGVGLFCVYCDHEIERDSEEPDFESDME